MSEQTIPLQLKIHSKGSERRIKKWLLGIHGVRRVDFDANNGVVLVSGTIDPPTLLMILENYGVKAEIYGRRRRSISPVNNKETVAQPKVINPLNDPDIAALLEHLPINSAGLKTMEVTKTVKFEFRDHGDKNLGITTKNRGVDHKPHGRGLCGASSSCCGDHAVMNNMHCCPHGGCPRRNGNIFCANYGIFPMSLPQPVYGGFSLLGARPQVAVGVPSAPPLRDDDNSPAYPPPPPGTNPFYTAFSDDNTSSSCTIM